MARRPRRVDHVQSLFARALAAYRRPPRFELKHGVWSFEQPAETTAGFPGVPRWSSTDRLWGATLRTLPVTVGTRNYKLVQFRGGRTEVYRVDPDGLEMFVGYADEVLRRVIQEGA